MFLQNIHKHKCVSIKPPQTLSTHHTHPCHDAQRKQTNPTIHTPTLPPPSSPPLSSQQLEEVQA